jgi:hypothetical protein
MSATAVGHCGQCAAVVNRHWPSCLVCHAPLIATPSHEEAFSETAAPMPPLQAAENIVVEPAAENPRPVYWERADLSIVGPGRPEFLAKVGSGATERFWVIVEFQGQPAWVSSDRLRSRKAFEQQPEVRVVKPIPRNGF